jgi:hypothetical protein
MSTATQTFNVGDRVTFPPESLVKEHLKGVTFVVTETPRENPRIRTLRIQQEGGGPKYRVRPDELIPATAPEGSPPGSRPFQPIEFFDAGQVVTISNGQRKSIGADEPFVVLKDSGAGNVNVAKLGGADGQAWRWPRAGLVKRDVAWLTERLVEMV